MMCSTIIPFKATYYNRDKIGDLSKLTCPPYDIISDKQRDEFRNNSPYNFCNVLLASNNNYQELGRRLKNWLTEKVLIDDERESLYLYEQQFVFDGQSYRRFGIISLLRMNKKGVIFPHEYTLKEPKVDRKKIIEEVQANLSPIFVVIPKKLKAFSQAYRMVLRKKPFFQFSDYQGNLNRVWKIQEKPYIDKICREVQRQKLVIADGHHRFEVAYAYYRRDGTLKKNLNYILAYLACPQEGLLILPTHRVVSTKYTSGIFFKKLERYFSTRKVTKKCLCRQLEKKGTFSFGVYRDGEFYFLKLKDSSILKSLPQSEIYKELDTYLLHQLVLPLVAKEEKILYTHDLDEAVKIATRGRAAFILRPAQLHTVFDIANQGFRLPQKSTYFYPKLLSGIVLRRFEDADTRR